jgi:hypothetical protein
VKRWREQKIGKGREQQESNLKPRSKHGTAAHQRPEQTVHKFIIIQRSCTSNQGIINQQPKFALDANFFYTQKCGAKVRVLSISEHTFALNRLRSQ